jgi:hypothetical protein
VIREYTVLNFWYFSPQPIEKRHQKKASKPLIFYPFGRGALHLGSLRERKRGDTLLINTLVLIPSKKVNLFLQ